MRRSKLCLILWTWQVHRTWVIWTSWNRGRRMAIIRKYQVSASISVRIWKDWLVCQNKIVIPSLLTLIGHCIKRSFHWTSRVCEAWAAIRSKSSFKDIKTPTENQLMKQKKSSLREPTFQAGKSLMKNETTASPKCPSWIWSCVMADKKFPKTMVLNLPWAFAKKSLLTFSFKNTLTNHKKYYQKTEK